MILAPGLPQLPAYTEASLMIWTRGLANGAHEGSPPDSGPGPQPAPGLHRGFVHDLGLELHPGRHQHRGFAHDLDLDPRPS